MTDQLEPLLDTDEAAPKVGAKPATMEKWRRDGTGPEYIKVGRLVRYTPSALRDYLQSNTVAPKREAR